MKASGRPILNAFKRGYSAQAQSARSAEKVTLPEQQTKVTKLGNGAIVASLENYSPVSKVGVFYNCGPRYEPANQKGITHCIRSAVNLSTEKSSAFGITRGVQQTGGSLSCSATREMMVYSLECLRSELDSGIAYLSAATQPAFRPWELSETADRMKLDLAMLEENPQVRMIEAMHAAAFRNGLGNSLYSPPHHVNYFTPDMLQSFVSSHFTSGNMAIVGFGVDHEQLLIYAKDIATNNAPAPTKPKSAFSAEQVRIETNSPFVHAAVVTEGVGDSLDAFALMVLQKVMGSGPYVKYSNNAASSKVSKAAAQATTNPVAATCIATPYTDSGFFGFQVVAQAGDIDKVLKSVAATFGEATKGGITDADVQRAKKQLNAAFFMAMEDKNTHFFDFGLQALSAGQVMPLDDVAGTVDKVTLADVQNVAKKVINGKPAMAAVGDLSNTPYLDELF